MVQVLLGGQNLGVAAHLPHLALDGFDLPPLESFLQGGAGCGRGREKKLSTGCQLPATTGIMFGCEDQGVLMLWICPSTKYLFFPLTY